MGRNPRVLQATQILTEFHQNEGQIQLLKKPDME